MASNTICNIINSHSFILKVNEMLPNFNLISKALFQHEIKFESWCPAIGIPPFPIEMAFSEQCSFQDVYLLAFLFKDYGLESIYPCRKDNAEVLLGTYLFRSDTINTYAIAKPINIDTFLLLDIRSSTKDVIDNHFGNCLEPIVIKVENDEKGDDEYYERDYNDSDDWKRDYFNAMTDGQFGSYDDFEGDVDDTWSRG